MGPKLEKLIAKVAGPRLVDLVFDLPVGVVDRSYRPKLIAAETGPHRHGGGECAGSSAAAGEEPALSRCACRTTRALMDLVFFRADADYLTGILPPGARRLMSGRIERFKDRLQMAHPDYVVAPEEIASFPLHEPVYGLTEGLTAKSMAKAVRGALEKVPAMPEWQDAAFLKQRSLAPFQRGAGGGARSGA